jgi:hypothetical protein
VIVLDDTGMLGSDSVSVMSLYRVQHPLSPVIGFEKSTGNNGPPFSWDQTYRFHRFQTVCMQSHFHIFLCLMIPVFLFPPKLPFPSRSDKWSTWMTHTSVSPRSRSRWISTTVKSVNRDCCRQNARCTDCLASVSNDASSVSSLFMWLSSMVRKSSRDTEVITVSMSGWGK